MADFAGLPLALVRPFAIRGAASATVDWILRLAAPGGRRAASEGTQEPPSPVRRLFRPVWQVSTCLTPDGMASLACDAKSRLCALIPQCLVSKSVAKPDWCIVPGEARTQNLVKRLPSRRFSGIAGNSHRVVPIGRLRRVVISDNQSRDLALIAGPPPVGAIFIFAAITFALPTTPVFSKRQSPAEAKPRHPTTDPAAERS